MVTALEAALNDLFLADAVIQPHITAVVLPQALLHHLPCPGTETITYPFDVTEDENKEDPEENSDNASPNQDDNLHIGPVIRACGTGGKLQLQRFSFHAPARPPLIACFRMWGDWGGVSA